jgi:hypothetical protein
MMPVLFFFFPETAHPGTCGIDKIQVQKKAFVWIDQLHCLAFLRSPNIFVAVSQFDHNDHTPNKFLWAPANSFVFVPDLGALQRAEYDNPANRIYHCMHERGFASLSLADVLPGAKFLISMLFLPSGLGNIGASPRVCYAFPVSFLCLVGAPIGGSLVVRKAKEKWKS